MRLESPIKTVLLIQKIQVKYLLISLVAYANDYGNDIFYAQIATFRVHM